MTSLLLTGVGRDIVAVAAAGPVTWDPANIGTNITLSGSNLIATMTSGNFSICRSTTAKSSGKFYLEIVFTTIASAGDTVSSGFANGSAALGNGANAYLGKDTNSVGLYNTTGNLYYNDTTSTLGTSVGWTVSNVVCWALDFDNAKFWARIGPGDWNLDPTANPATNTNGKALTVTGPFYFAATLHTNTDSCTVSFLSTSWTQAAPSGFGQWT